MGLGWQGVGGRSRAQQESALREGSRLFLGQKVQESALIKPSTLFRLPASLPRGSFLGAFEAGPFRNPQWVNGKVPCACSPHVALWCLDSDPFTPGLDEAGDTHVCRVGEGQTQVNPGVYLASVSDNRE